MHLPVVALALLLLGSAAPPAVEAQQAGKVYRIGILELIPASLNTANLAAFQRALSALSYDEGRNLTIDYRSADGRNERLPELAAELVRQRPDAIVTRGTPAALAAKDATRTIPIVMAASGDPVGSGIVGTLARPGGNVTGLSSFLIEASGKRVQLLREVSPAVSRVGFLTDTRNPASKLSWGHVQAACAALGLQPSLLDARTAAAVRHAFDIARQQNIEALTVGFDVAQQNRDLVIDLAAKYRIPAIYGLRELPEAGGLMAYAVSYPELFRRAAEFVDRIFKGTRPGDLPIEQPTKFELVINLKTANALGLTIPQALLLQADHVIQ